MAERKGTEHKDSPAEFAVRCADEVEAERKPASRLRIARVKSGWRIGRLAKAIDVAESTLYRIENDMIKEPRLRIRTALAKALRAKEADLFRKAGKK